MGPIYGQNLNDLVLRNGETFSSVNRSRIESFSIDNVTDVSPFRPELKIVAQSPSAHDTDISVHYLVNNIGWTGDYACIYDPENNVLHVKSWVRIYNNTGSQFNTDVIVLVAGNPQRVRNEDPQFARQTVMALRDVPQQEQSTGYHNKAKHTFIIPTR